jgi:hypothetical protein
MTTKGTNALPAALWGSATFTAVPSMNATAEPMIVAARTQGAGAGARDRSPAGAHALVARRPSYVRPYAPFPGFAASSRGEYVRRASVSHPALFAPASYALSMNPRRVSLG